MYTHNFFSLSLSLCIYVYVCIYIYIYIYTQQIFIMIDGFADYKCCKRLTNHVANAVALTLSITHSQESGPSRTGRSIVYYAIF